ncbi:MAG TPA: PorV/PorQ family protein [Candidatus Saccharimonadales bacterium]|nr:PorV/PorQ family protein [Candidatus Saccharimonadales bacterium]
MTSSARRARCAWIAAGLLLLAPALARAQGQELGGQRRGTASLEFLKIGVGARAEGMGEAFVSVANDPSAMYWNPAGIGTMLRREIQVSTVDYPADIHYSQIMAVLPSQALGGSLGFMMGGFSVDMNETDEYHPFGTGRTFTFSDFVLGAAYARRFTDRLLIGFGMKYAREDFGSQIDAPATGAILFDIGSVYYIGWRSLRVGMSLTNFGGEAGPGGTFISPNTSIQRAYDAFSPPTMFRYGLAFEPIERESFRWTTAVEASQASDNAIEFRAGTELLLAGHLALRTGYQIRNDAFGFCGGAGFRGEIGGLNGQIDYAYTDAGPLGHVSRLSLQAAF